MYKIIRNFAENRRGWLVLWVAIWLSFLTIDLIWPGHFSATVLRYGGILLCAAYAFWYGRSDTLLCLALVFTLLADTVLVIDSTSEIGVAIFAVAQLLHLFRLTGKNNSPAFIKYLVVVTILTGLSLIRGQPIMLIVASVYGATLIINVILAWTWHFRAKTISSACAAIGFSLFLMCDSCVAVSYLSLTGALPFVLYGIANYYSWLFYYPSQVLISNSEKTSC